VEGSYASGAQAMTVNLQVSKGLSFSPKILKLAFKLMQLGTIK